MKKLSQEPQEHVFFLATENLVLRVKEPYRIQQQMIEMKNFVPEAFMIHHFQESKEAALDCNNYLKLSRGEMIVPPSLFDPRNSQSDLWMAPGEDGDDDDWEDDDDEWEDDDDDDDEWDEDDDDF